MNWCGVSESLARAKAAMDAQEFEQAEHILQELLDFAPRELRGWKMLARLQRNMGKIEQGIKSATIALRLQQERTRQTPAPTASLRLAKMCWQQGDHQGALSMLQELLAQQPQQPQLLALKMQWEQEAA